MITKEQFVDSLQGFTVSRETLDKLDVYAQLLKKWQKSINLVSDSTLNDIWNRHFLDSAQLVKYIPSGKYRIVDFGSGAGFPILVYATLLQNTKNGADYEFHTIESDSRKCAFMREVVRNLELNINIHNSRIEQISLGFFDFITARALASLDGLLTYARPFITKNSTCIFLKGENLATEMMNFNRKWEAKITEYPSLSDKTGKVVVLKNIKEL